MRKLLTGLMIATTLLSGVGATAAMAAPRHDHRPAHVQVTKRTVVTHHDVRGNHRNWHRGRG